MPSHKIRKVINDVLGSAALQSFEAGDIQLMGPSFNKDVMSSVFSHFVLLPNKTKMMNMTGMGTMVGGELAQEFICGFVARISVDLVLQNSISWKQNLLDQAKMSGGASLIGMISM